MNIHASYHVILTVCYCVMCSELGVKLWLVGRSPYALIYVSREALVPNDCTGVIISHGEGDTDNAKVILFVCRN